MSSAGQDTARAVGELYAVCYARLVRTVGAITGDRALAEEAVQDAFVRVLGQWPTVSSYDNPEAWVRRAALGYASNRRRKVGNGMRAMLRQGPEPDVAGPTGDAVDLRRALRTLPKAQREVLVLQGLGLSVHEIARDLGVPTGTVKSRLSRARAALSPLLREENEHV